MLPKLWINNYPSDFVMACGDDWTDEDTFRSMPKDAYSIKVGSNSSVANYRVSDFTEIRALLKTLT